jgi:hypothetical protein
MTPTEFQTWLNAHGAALVVDDHPGALTRQAILGVFTNLAAPAINPVDIGVLAARLGCDSKQLSAVAHVESGGSGFDVHGRPKILFERHYFHRLTQGRWSVCDFSNREGGGYGESSWDKLTAAACKDVDAAFSSTSWGKFQVMGAHWHALHYDSPLEMAYSTVSGEAAHYEMLARFIEANDLKPELRALSADPSDCALFAKRYNGPGYKQNRYDEKLAEYMK